MIDKSIAGNVFSRRIKMGKKLMQMDLQSDCAKKITNWRWGNLLGHLVSPNVTSVYFETM